MLANTVVVSLLAFNASAAGARSTANATGHWEGTITAPMAEIEFEVDVTRDASGALVATYGQKGTGVRGLPLTNVALDGRMLTFVLFNGGPGGGSFTGEILTDGKSMSGEVKATMGSATFMLYRTGEAVMLPVVRNTRVSTSLEGTWTGSLDVSGNQIGLTLTIANRPDGTASVVVAQVLRPDFRVDAALKENGRTVSFDVPATSGSWSGAITIEGESMTGTWTQSGGSWPLTFTKTR